MSVLFNQTNIAPGTSFVSTVSVGGGSNFPQGIFTSSIVGLSTINGVVYPPTITTPSFQAGQYAMTGATETVSLATPFPDTNWSVVVNPINIVPTYNWSAYVVRNDAFTIEASASGLTFNWIAAAYTQ